MIPSATDHDDATSTRRKATLFCWECEHSSPVDGDWQLQPRKRSLAYVCPECETTITTRPRSTEPAPSRASAMSGPFIAWQHTVHASASAWRASIAVGLSSLTALTELAAAGSRSRSQRCDILTRRERRGFHRRWNTSEALD
ncbi:hypothetical protein ACFR99_04980 [Haloarchaeobius amylolyticus]|uniref:DUF8106 domain-containing protein n=1 Tax=Haloarchaeobius amylolyticus TaxID=1198296 RepID=A0ABD6BDZ9_9EURY